ncbi:metallophosphoesterase [Nocardioides sp. CFH 31398]|uniref:metallophosphoesterase n=1 Tax=Nocardioides sp. CFH 31398 TaxID=2919579 RepID=UPI001F06F9A3|nr:metallophosphoesterase [Nocardioides sp. CFH 31398]MCH1865398.1 metallophosphoesterase [Nocardioides sp. CFH 31398]
MRIGLVGDVEGELAVVVDALRLLAERGDVKHVVQLGDLRYGMGPDPEGYLDAIEAACVGLGLRLDVVPGNHENWALLDSLWSRPASVDDTGRLLPLRLREHVTMLPRGHRWTLGGRSVVALGGAPSMSVGQRPEGVEWWPTEVLLDHHVDAVVADGPADVMLTHDSPGPPYCVPEVDQILHRNVRDNPRDWSPRALAHAETGMTRMTRAVLGVAPRFLAHGHFHVAGEDVVRLPGSSHDTTVWSLSARGEPGSVRVLDLDTLGPAPGG